MLEQDIIIPSVSEWCSPVVMVDKPDGTYRMAVDYRALNAVTKSSNYPIPSIDSILYSMCNSRVFSTLDLKSGFWQAAIHPDDQPKTLLCVKRVFISLSDYHLV
ncbi:Retrovirus-related Pol polyprotein from transposon [Apostichopus japonicus]|uniref:Retrovirus-related Pol polyprotein from transposon n=1 Tax=Stichopus japonicus TaxID=307972 RepID=A0A2G8KC05_STIJA|nr:Retrovirus-related Pol polyprotein from transposon [Apostichopus japonicus]